MTPERPASQPGSKTEITPVGRGGQICIYWAPTVCLLAAVLEGERAWDL